MEKHVEENVQRIFEHGFMWLFDCRSLINWQR